MEIEEFAPAHAVQVVYTSIVDRLLEIGPAQLVAIKAPPLCPEISKKGCHDILRIMGVVRKFLRIIPQLPAVVVIRRLEQDCELLRGKWRKAFFMSLNHGFRV